MNSLPLEVTHSVFSWLTAGELCNAGRVCRSWHEVAEDNVIWKYLFESRAYDCMSPPLVWGPWPPLKCFPSDLDYRMRYKAFTCIQSNWESFLSETSWSNPHSSPSPCRGHAVSSLQFAGSRVVSGSFDKTVCLSDLCSKRVLDTIRMPARVSCVRFVDEILLVGMCDGNISCCSISRDDHIRPLDRVLENNFAWCERLAFDGTAILAAYDTGDVKEWCCETGQEVRNFPGLTANALSLQFDDTIVIAGGTNNSIYVWDRRSSAHVMALTHKNRTKSLQFDATRSVLVTGTASDLVKWDLRMGSSLRVMSDAHKYGVLSMQFDGKKIISGGRDKYVKVWSFESGDMLHSWGPYSDWTGSVQFDDIQLVYATRDIVMHDFAYNCAHCAGYDDAM